MSRSGVVQNLAASAVTRGVVRYRFPSVLREAGWGLGSQSPQEPVASGHKELLPFITLSHTDVPVVSVEKDRKHLGPGVLTLQRAK